MAMRIFPRCIAQCTGVSPRVLPGISTYSSCTKSRLTRREIGDGEFVIGVGGDGIVDAGIGAGAGTGVGVVASAGAGSTGAGTDAATMGTGVGIGT